MRPYLWNDLFHVEGGRTKGLHEPLRLVVEAHHEVVAHAAGTRGRRARVMSAGRETGEKTSSWGGDLECRAAHLAWTLLIHMSSMKPGAARFLLLTATRISLLIETSRSFAARSLESSTTGKASGPQAASPANAAWAPIPSERSAAKRQRRERSSVRQRPRVAPNSTEHRL